MTLDLRTALYVIPESRGFHKTHTHTKPNQSWHVTSKHCPEVSGIVPSAFTGEPLEGLPVIVKAPSVKFLTALEPSSPRWCDALPELHIGWTRTHQLLSVQVAPGRGTVSDCDWRRRACSRHPDVFLDVGEAERTEMVKPAHGRPYGSHDGRHCLGFRNICGGREVLCPLMLGVLQPRLGQCPLSLPMRQCEWRRPKTHQEQGPRLCMCMG